MVRWKTPRRLKRRRAAGENYEFNVDESLKDNEEESEEDEEEDHSSTQRIRCDGEHEDNYRDPMIRMGYFSLTIFSFFFNPFAVGLSFWLEWSVCSEKSDYQEVQTEKEEYGLLSPTMSTILEINQSKFKEEIKFLKECNASLTSSTLINAGTMTRFANMNPLSLSWKLLRSGSSSFQQAAAQEVSRCLNRVGHFCLNVFATTTFLMAVTITCAPHGHEMTSGCAFVFYAAAMWMQLATIRCRKTIPLVLSALIEIAIFAWVAVSSFQLFGNESPSVGIKDYLFSAFFVIVTIVRLVCMAVLFKVLMFKTPQYSFSNTVFLKPTNTPVSFSSVLAPQELDPTNPYYPQTVYNNNLVKNTLLDKSST